MAVDAVGGTSGSAGTNSQANPIQSSGLDKLANEQTFLKLFIAQLKNQDPLNPQDGTQFVAQLAQFSNLEQTLGMHSELTAIRTDLEKYFGTGTDSTKGS